jgi:hypothetical protein
MHSLNKRLLIKPEMLQYIKESTNKFISIKMKPDIKKLDIIKKISDIKHIDNPNSVYLLSVVSIISFLIGYRLK